MRHLNVALALLVALVAALLTDGAAAHDSGHGTATETAAFAALAANATAYVIQVSTTDSYQDLFEVSDDEGTLEYHSPDGMYSDRSVAWIERLRLSNPDSVNQRLNIHRGTSQVAWNTGLQDVFNGPNNDSAADNWVLYVIDITSERWVMIDMAGLGVQYGGGYMDFYSDSLIFVGNSSNITSAAERSSFFRTLTSSRVVLAITPDRTYTPTYGDYQPPPVQPAAPASVTAGSATTTSIAFSWPASTGATSYGYQYKKAADATWETEQTTNGTSATLTGLDTDTAYDFQVRAMNNAGASVYTQGSGSTTALAAPTGFTVSAVGMTATLVWDAVAEATAYEYQRKLSTEQSWGVSVEASSPATVSGLAAGLTHDFQVRAKNAGGARRMGWRQRNARARRPCQCNGRQRNYNEH